MSVRDDLKSLFALREAPGRWRIALQAALSIGIPAVGFALAGRADLGLLASTGSFTALHLAMRSRHERLLWLPFIGAGLIIATAIGAAASANFALTVVALFLVAVVASVLCLGWAMGPPGGMFFMLAAGVGARLAGPKSGGGDALPFAIVVGMVAVGAVVAYGVVAAPLLVPRVRRFNAQLRSEQSHRRFAIDPVTRLIIVRITIAAAIGAIAAAPLGVHRVYWVLLTVIVILQNGHQVRFGATRAVQRVLGTFVGLGVFALVLVWNPRDLVLAFFLTLLQFLVELIVVRNYGFALVLITPLALVIATQGTSVDVGQIVGERVFDTVLGSAIALAVLLLSWLVARSRSRPAL
ncbi:hypothetical protein BH11ACT2_BH11ACT2_05060 [soil metagenome]